MTEITEIQYETVEREVTRYRCCVCDAVYDDESELEELVLNPEVSLATGGEVMESDVAHPLRSDLEFERWPGSQFGNHEGEYGFTTRNRSVPVTRVDTDADGIEHICPDCASGDDEAVLSRAGDSIGEPDPTDDRTVRTVAGVVAIVHAVLVGVVLWASGTVPLL